MSFKLSLFLVAAVTANAQSVGQIGASAAGGTAAGAAGKVVSDGFDKVMSQAGGLTGKAAETGKAKPKPKGRLAPIPPPEPALPQVISAKPAKPSALVEVEPPAPPPVAKASSKARRAAPKVTAERQAQKVTAPVFQPAPEPAAAPKRPAVSQELPKVEVGTTRIDLVARLGSPAGRITSVDERGLVEVYSFREGRTHVGSVRLVNGKVTEVRQAP